MLKYNVNLKHNALRLRREMTNRERVLWVRLRGKQVLQKLDSVMDMIYRAVKERM